MFWAEHNVPNLDDQSLVPRMTTTSSRSWPTINFPYLLIPSYSVKAQTPITASCNLGKSVFINTHWQQSTTTRKKKKMFGVDPVSCKAKEIKQRAFCLWNVCKLFGVKTWCSVLFGVCFEYPRMNFQTWLYKWLRAMHVSVWLQYDGGKGEKHQRTPSQSWHQNNGNFFLFFNRETEYLLQRKESFKLL